jgi:hypothetical protein
MCVLRESSIIVGWPEQVMMQHFDSYLSCAAMCLPDGLCRLTAGLSVSFQRPFVARHRPEWQLRPVCLCLKQWALFPELNIEMCIRDNRCDLCMGMEYPPAFACAFVGPGTPETLRICVKTSHYFVCRHHSFGRSAGVCNSEHLFLE